MAELDPSIILQAGKSQGINAADLLERRDQIQLRNLALAKSQREEQAATQKAQTLRDIGTRYASGDVAGARNAAAASGDFGTVSTLDQLSDAQRNRAAEIAKATAPLLLSLKNVAPAGRTAALAQIAPQLQQYGFTPDHIQQLAANPQMLSDQGLDQIGQSALTLQEQYQREKDTADRALREKEADANRDLSRSNAYISAGYFPPGGAAPASGATSGPSGPTTGLSHGWTPYAGNPKEAVDNKMTGMSQALGVGIHDPFPAGTTPMEIVQALTLSEGGKGSLADRNNNPGNLTDPKTGAYRRFPTKQAGMDAAAAQVRRNLARGQNSIYGMVAGIGGNQGTPSASPSLTPLPGGKLDKPKAARMTPDEVAAEGLDPKLTYYRGTDGVPQAVSGQNNRSSLKPPPATAITAYNGNRNSIGQIDEAIRAINAYPDASGFLVGNTPNAISSRTDPKGVDARAKIANIGSLLIHDRSGAAVTASETPRLLPFIPQVSDNAETVKKKLENLRANLVQSNSDIEDVYSENQGYKFPTFRAPPGQAGTRAKGTLSANVPTMTPEQARKAAAGTRFKTTDGRIMVKQ